MYLKFYQSLPTTKQYPLYIKGYTEALETFSGVRVVPDNSFLEGIDRNVINNFLSVGTPCYFVPIHQHNKCYGYVLKGHQKKTIKVANKKLLPGFEQVTEGCVVYLVEGFKDSYLLRSANKICLPILTSIPTLETLQILKQLDTKLVYCADNDILCDQNKQGFLDKATRAGFSVENILLWNLTEYKDLGDFFNDNKSRKDILIQTKSLIHEVKNKWNL